MGWIVVRKAFNAIGTFVSSRSESPCSDFALLILSASVLATEDATIFCLGIPIAPTKGALSTIS